MAEMQTVNVDLGERSYPIHIGSGLLDKSDLISPHIKSKQVCIITNDTIAPLYLHRLEKTLEAYELSVIILPDGESHKTLETISVIYDELLNKRFERSGTLIALGGGVVGDMVGFAAATYQRGINFIQIPTTLLSQVDSSVGGKTGVNRPLGKNMVGAFYQPQCVIVDVDTLQTLAERELKAGMAEVVKYGLINDYDFYLWLRENSKKILELDADSLRYAIKISCEQKACIVALDEKEAGVRATLNLGHTFGHAIETAMGYGVWLHGEAVATGMLMAADLSSRLGLLSVEQALEVKALLKSIGLPLIPPPDISVDDFMSLMSRDKKAEFGKIRFVLLESIGKATLEANVAKDVLVQTLRAGDKLAE